MVNLGVVLSKNTVDKLMCLSLSNNNEHDDGKENGNGHGNGHVPTDEDALFLAFLPPTATEVSGVPAVDGNGRLVNEGEAILLDLMLADLLEGGVHSHSLLHPPRYGASLRPA